MGATALTVESDDAWEAIAHGDRVAAIDFGTVQNIDEDGDAEVLWDISGCIGDIDLDRLRPAAAVLSCSQAAADVVAERRRQVEAEGWTPEHDDAHTLGELSRAAACYALQATLDNHIGDDALPVSWPRSWHCSWWKPKDRRRDLVRAAALIIAEIERLDRAEARTTPQEAMP